MDRGRTDLCILVNSSKILGNTKRRHRSSIKLATATDGQLPRRTRTAPLGDRPTKRAFSHHPPTNTRQQSYLKIRQIRRLCQRENGDGQAPPKKLRHLSVSSHNVRTCVVYCNVYTHATEIAYDYYSDTEYYTLVVFFLTVILQTSVVLPRNVFRRRPPAVQPFFRDGFRFGPRP